MDIIQIRRRNESKKRRRVDPDASLKLGRTGSPDSQRKRLRAMKAGEV
jgi:hypothetical protein